MEVQRQNININFAQGLDTKTDPFQLAPGNFLSLKNTIFTKAKRLGKRNGFGTLTSINDSSVNYLTTFNGNLSGIGDFFYAYSQSTNQWYKQGPFTSVDVNVLPLVRSNTSQTYADSAVSSNGLVCTVYTDNIVSGSSTVPAYKYVIADVNTGQNILGPALIPTTGVVTYAPKVFFLGNYFILVFDSVISATNHLQYLSINTFSLIIGTATDISTQYTAFTTGSFDGVVANNSLYLAWNGSDSGGAIRIRYLDSTLNLHTVKVLAATNNIANLMSVCADTTQNVPNIYVTFYNTSAQNFYSTILSSTLTTIVAITAIYNTAGPISNLSTCAQNQQLTTFYEFALNYGYNSSIPNHLISTGVYNFSLGQITLGTLARGVGIASKAFIYQGNIYLLGIYSSAYQPTYFLLTNEPFVVAKLAYSNGGSYLFTGLPNVSIVNDLIYIPYQFADLIEAVNKSQGVVNSAGIYSQTGINLVQFSISNNKINSAELGHDLHLSGGFLWMYDGFMPVEHLFHLWPDYVEATATATTGGALSAQIYYAQVCYEWTDAQGNIFRSAPSIPVIKDLSSSMTSTNTITWTIPTLRLTYKISSPVKIVIYRWSTAQQDYYQCTSVSVPLLNDLSVDYISFVDKLSDSEILGNNLIYTTGGVVENIAAPACDIMTIFKSRLMILDAEDRNLVWYSKQVIEGTPAETSDLFTLYIAPNIGVQGNTGNVSAMASMDDKLILFKKNGAIFYLTGTGPDNTGANNDFSDPVFITTAVGCNNQNSIILIPNGLMFQDGNGKGIWLLGRDLSTSYIGSPVEDFNALEVLSVVNVPGTNQVRFTMESGVVLMYDYFFAQWGEFVGIPAISSIIYNDLHTFINSIGQIYQETPGLYIDGSVPVLISFKTAWFNLAGVQGLLKAYEFFFLGSYLSPHKLYIQVAFDYNPTPIQYNIFTPDNFAGPFGSDTIFGGSQYFGGPLSKEQGRVFLTQQKVQSFQIYLQETFDPSYGTVPGAGLTLSGLNLTVGMLKSRPLIPTKNTVG